MGGGGGAYLLLALSLLAIDHASLSRRGTVPTLIETPPTFGRSLRLFHTLHELFAYPFPSCFAVCGHHLIPRIAIVFSLLSSLPNSSMSRTFNSLMSSNASRSSLYISHSPTMWVLLYHVVVPHGHTFVATSSSRLLVYLFFLVGPRSPTRNRTFSFFA